MNRRFGQSEPIRNKRDQRRIRFTIDRRCGKTDFQGIAVKAGNFGFLGAWLDMQGQERASIPGLPPLSHVLQENSQEEQQRLCQQEHNQEREINACNRWNDAPDRIGKRTSELRQWRRQR